MTEIQEHIMALMKEIDKVCRINGITYILHGQTAGCVVKNGRFKTGAYPFHLIVREEDAEKLKDALEAASYEEREIETRALNPELEMDVIRYVDSGTCLFDRKEAAVYRCPGAAVTIHPIREKKKHEKGVKAFFGGLLGRKEAAEFYELEISPGEYRTFPAECITKTRRIRFEDMELPVSENSDLFFASFFGPDWQNRYAEEMQSTNSSFVIWDAQNSYRQYEEAFAGMSVNMPDLFRKIRSLNDFMSGEYEEKKAEMLRLWNTAKESEDRIARERGYGTADQ